MSRRWPQVVLVLGFLVLLGGFVTPVTADGYTCGLAGTGFPYLGDPSGPGEPPEIYGEYNACGRAAAVPHLVMSGGLLLLLAGLIGFVVARLRDPRW